MATLWKNIFVTGLPGSGKTTFIMKLAEELRDERPAGFFTEETRSHGARTGFRLTSFDGRSAGMLAHRQVSWIPSYGPEMRGGTANCSVTISDREIGSPLIEHPTLLVALTGRASSASPATSCPAGRSSTTRR